MSNRSMNLRIANHVADAQNLERLGDSDMDVSTILAAGRYREAADTLVRVLCHCDRRTRREAQRHVNRLHAKANRIYRATGFFRPAVY